MRLSVFTEDIMREIKLTQNKVTLVDDSNFEYLNQFKWYALRSNNTYYAVRNIRLKNGKQTMVLMHRLIMNTPKRKLTDHKDRNGLNNQNDNLRVCTNSQNAINKSTKRGTSQFRGVYLLKIKSPKKTYQYWMARITYNNNNIYLGYYKTEQDAAIVYNQKAIELFGNFAVLNNV
jgi:hypothetical protein